MTLRWEEQRWPVSCPKTMLLLYYHVSRTRMVFLLAEPMTVPLRPANVLRYNSIVE